MSSLSLHKVQSFSHQALGANGSGFRTSDAAASVTIDPATSEKKCLCFSLVMALGFSCAYGGCGGLAIEHDGHDQAFYLI
jgi:hypothetical protein